MEGRPIDELSDVTVQGVAFDEFRVEVCRVLEDRVNSGPAVIAREGRHLREIDQTGAISTRYRQAAVRAQRHIRLLLEPGDDINGVTALDGRIRPVKGCLQRARHDHGRHPSHPGDPFVVHVGSLHALGEYLTGTGGGRAVPGPSDTAALGSK
jgi:hypothetical protein